MKKYINSLVLMVCLVGIVNVNAEQCVVNFRHYFVRADGYVGFYLGTSGYWWYPCNVSSDANGVTAEVCKSTLSTYMTSKLIKKSITLSWGGICDELTAPTTSIAGRGFNWFGIYDM